MRVCFSWFALFVFSHWSFLSRFVRVRACVCGCGCSFVWLVVCLLACLLVCLFGCVFAVFVFSRFSASFRKYKYATDTSTSIAA